MTKKMQRAKPLLSNQPFSKIITEASLRQRMKLVSLTANLNHFVDYDPEFLKNEDNKKYDWTQVTTFIFDAKAIQSPFYPIYQSMDDPDSMPDDMWELDDRLIDPDMTQLEGEEANRLYKDLKERALRQFKKAMSQKKMEKILNEEEEFEDEENQFAPTGQPRQSMAGQDDFKQN